MKKILVAAASWPLSDLYWKIPAHYDGPFFFSLIMLLWLVFSTDFWKMFNEFLEDFVDPFSPDIFDECLNGKKNQSTGWLSHARAFALEHVRVNGHVSMNDINDMIDRGLFCEPPEQTLKSSIFRHRDFIKIDTEPSLSPNSRGGRISVWGKR